MTAHVNVIVTKGGKHRPVCEFCGKAGRAVTPTGRGGQLSVLDVAPGWSCAPYPEDFVHPDGSTGSTWTCPACQRRLDRGEVLRTRDGGEQWRAL